jgi:hypothetical protein
MTKITKIFLASSSELVDDRIAFEIFINRKNKLLVKYGVFLELVIWEDFLDVMSKTRLQEEYNKAIRECDIFIMLFYSKVGKYTEEEFGVAFKEFQENEKPLIYTYFKTGAEESDESVATFQVKLDALGHFFTTYQNTDKLLLHFHNQVDKLIDKGIINATKNIINSEGEQRQKSLLVKKLNKLKERYILLKGTDATMEFRLEMEMEELENMMEQYN